MSALTLAPAVGLEGRTPPHDLDTEAALLAAVLIDDTALAKVSDFLRLEHFYSEAHRRLFEAVLAVRESGAAVDIQTVVSRLRETGRLATVGGAGAVVEIANASTTLRNVRDYATIVFDRWRARTLLFVCQRATAEAYLGVPDVQAFAESVARAVTELSRMRAGSKVESNLETLTRVVAQLRKGEDPNADRASNRGMPTGLPSWDHHTLGLHAGQKTTIVARPRVGKTALALQFAIHGSQHGIGSAVFSTEMGRDELAIRQIAHLARVDGRRLQSALQNLTLTTEEWHRVYEALSRLAKIRPAITVFDEASPTVEDICARSRLLAEQSVAVDGVPLGMVVVDYVQKLRPSALVERKKKYEQIGYATERLKDLARELNVAVIELAQEKNTERERSGKRPRPQLGDAAECFQIERSADNVMYLYRPDESNARDVRVVIAKQRGGDEGEFDLTFERQFSRFVECDPYGPKTALSRQYVDDGDDGGNPLTEGLL